MKRFTFPLLMILIPFVPAFSQTVWQGDDISQMQNAGFNCQGMICKSTSEIQDLVIQSVGSMNAPAELILDNNITGYTNQSAIQISGSNDIDMFINSSLNGFFGIIFDQATNRGNITFGPNSIIYGSQTAIELKDTTVYGDIINNGHVNNKYWHGLSLVSSTINGNIKNSKFWRGGYNGILIDQDSTLNGYIYNSGEIIGAYGSIFNQSAHRLDYRGSGDVEEIHTAGGIEISDIDRAPINHITGAGGITYSDRGGATTLRISYTDNDHSNAKIKSEIGDLSLRNISISLDIKTQNLFYTGSYKIAESNTIVNAENISWLIDGNPISPNQYSIVMRGNGTGALWLDIIGNY